MKTELTSRAKSLHENLMSMINNTGKRISENELDYLLYAILDEKLMKKEEE